MRLTSLLLLALVSAPAHAGVVLAFDGARCYSSTYEYWLTGSAMTGPHAQTLAAGHTVVTTAQLTPADLAGADVFVSGVMPTSATYPQSEFDALAQWIAAGGSALFFGENASFAPVNLQYAQLCGVTFAGNVANYVPTVLAPTHPIAQGPAGTVSVLAQLLAAGSWSGLPGNATAITSTPTGAAGIVALEIGSGRVVLLNDSGFFAHPPNYVSDCPILWDNAIAWLMGGAGTGTEFCSGDGSAAACPCGNVGGSGEGCANSLGTGADLDAIGQARVSADSLVLAASGMPNSSALYFQGTQQLVGGLGAVFGDGLRCVGGTIIRLGTKSNAGGASQYPGPGDTAISVRGSCLPGDARTYQVWYRNAAAFCTASTFNLTNGIALTWNP